MVMTSNVTPINSVHKQNTQTSNPTNRIQTDKQMIADYLTVRQHNTKHTALDREA